MKIEYGFIEYPEPKTGVFRIDTNQYQLPIGWIQREEEHLIIGECPDSYVYILLRSKQGEWIGEVVIEREFILPIGIHKSRFVKWVPTQLTMFK